MNKKNNNEKMQTNMHRDDICIGATGMQAIINKKAV